MPPPRFRAHEDGLAKARQIDRRRAGAAGTQQLLMGTRDDAMLPSPCRVVFAAEVIPLYLPCLYP